MSDAFDPDFMRNVRAAATRFRAALELHRDHLAAISLRRFPCGACGDTSDMLGQYLTDCGLGPWQRVSGTKYQPKFGTHAWVEQDGLIVDITADQFDGVDEPVIVTTDWTWYARYPKQHSRSANVTDSYAQPTLAIDYATLRPAADAAV